MVICENVKFLFIFSKLRGTNFLDFPKAFIEKDEKLINKRLKTFS